MPFLAKSSILFVLLNFLRLLSIVAICLAFSGEVVTMTSDLRTVQSSSSSSSSPSPIPSTTASTKIFRRSFPVPVYSPVPTITSLPLNLYKREPASLRELDTSSPTSTRRSSRTSPAVTATNTPSSSLSPTATQACSYLSSTSIPTQPGGSLFSTLSRIFCCLILAFSLLSELPPPIMTRAGRAVEKWWNYVFPPFGREFGVGVLGGTQVFVGCTVLSHAVGKFTQVSGWLLFIVGILNLLCGLAFGSRLKVIRSPFADSTSPSALRKLRLGTSNSSSAHINAQDDDEGLEAMTERARDGQEERRKWYRFENASTEENSIGLHHPSASTSTVNNPSEGRRVHFGGAPGGGAGPKRSASRNGPNGIVISAPMQLRGGAGGLPEEKTVYGEMEEIRQNGASSRASSRGGGGISIPPPVYSGSH